MDGNGQAATFEYDARKRLTRETDARVFSATHEYDAVGNKIKSTDPRGYATWYVYDDLKRLVRGILPDTTAPANPYVSAEDNPYVEFTYDLVGNKLTERDPDGNLQSQAPDNLSGAFLLLGWPEMRTSWSWRGRYERGSVS